MYHAIVQHFKRFLPEIKKEVSDIYGRVTAISDAPINGQPSSFNRPGLSATVQILKANGESNLDVPELPALPVPSTTLNLDAVGVGDLVLVGFVFGSPRHPVIKAVYPNGSLLAGLNAGEQWQGSASTYQHINEKGFFRSALHEINENSFIRSIKANLINVEAEKETKVIKGLWSATVGAVLFKSLGSLKLFAASVLNLSSLDNINIRTNKDFNLVAKENVNETVTKNSTETITKNKRIECEKIYLGSSSVDLVAKVEALAAQVSALDDLVKAHTHVCALPGAASAVPVWVGVKTAVDAIKADIAKIKIG